MKKLNNEEMVALQASGFGDFMTGFCAGVGITSGVLALTGVGAPVAVAALAYGGIACGVGSLFT